MGKKVKKKKMARTTLKKKKKVVQQADSAFDARSGRKKNIRQKDGQESTAEGGQKPGHTLHARANRGGHPAAADQRTC